MADQFYLIDIGTGEGLKGSPTPVLITDKKMDPLSMQYLAGSWMQPVSAFIWREDQECRIRFFTPTMEISLCGHASMAAAAAVYAETGWKECLFRNPNDQIISVKATAFASSLQLKSAQLTNYRLSSQQLEALDDIKLKESLYSHELRTLFLELADHKSLIRLEPQPDLIMEAFPHIQELVITSTCPYPEYDFCLRSFGPWIGINEDPVTGSVHAALAPYWSEKLNKKQVHAIQCSDRGGALAAEVRNEIVLLKGNYLVREAHMLPDITALPLLVFSDQP